MAALTKKKSELLVFGYNREITAKCNIKHNIPDGIIDAWCQSLCTEKASIKDLVISTTNKASSDWQNVYGDLILSSPSKYHWKLKVHTPYPEFSTMIGVIKHPCRYDKVRGISFCGTESGYGIYSYSGDKFNDTYTHYAKAYGDEDIVEINLDLEKLTLSFAINGTSYGVAFEDLPNTGYRLALGMWGPSQQVEIMESYPMNT